MLYKNAIKYCKIGCKIRSIIFFNVYIFLNKTFFILKKPYNNIVKGVTYKVLSYSNSPKPNLLHIHIIL